MFRLFVLCFLISTAYCTVTSITVDQCNGLATASVVTDCQGTATAAGGSTACCLATWNTAPLLVKAATSATAYATWASAVQNPVSGSTTGTGTKFYGCFAKGAATHLRFKSGTDSWNSGYTTTTTNTYYSKESFIKASDVCGAAGGTPATFGTTANIYFYATGSTGTGVVTVASEAVSTTGASVQGASSKGAGMKDTSPTDCTCGTNVRPVDGCVALAKASVEASCTATPESGTSGAKKCCLATFNGIPTTPKDDSNEDPVTGPTNDKGAIINTNYFACYAATSGSIVFKTKTGAAESAKDAWVSSDTFCGSTVVNTDVDHASYSYDVKSVTGKKTSTKAGISGKATTCVCGSANVFTIGFTLLAILASLWK